MSFARAKYYALHGLVFAGLYLIIAFLAEKLGLSISPILAYGIGPIGAKLADSFAGEYPQ